MQVLRGSEEAPRGCFMRLLQQMLLLLLLLLLLHRLVSADCCVPRWASRPSTIAVQVHSGSQ